MTTLDISTPAAALLTIDFGGDAATLTLAVFTWDSGDAVPGRVHTIADVTGLQAALDAKVDDNDPRLDDARAPTTHEHVIADVTGLSDALADKEPVGSSAAAMAAHDTAVDPHPQYAKADTVGEANGIAPLDADGKVPAANLPAAILPTSSRKVIQGDTTYYVNPLTGSDTNDGTASAPFATTTKALEVVAALDCNGHAVVVQLADNAAYTDPIVLPPLVGAGQVRPVLRGNAANPLSVTIAPTHGANCVLGVTPDTNWLIEDVCLDSSGLPDWSYVLMATGGSRIGMGTIHFRSVNPLMTAMYAANGGFIYADGFDNNAHDYVFHGSGYYALLLASGPDAAINLQCNSMQFPDGISVTAASYYAAEGGALTTYINAATGAVTGKRFIVQDSSSINTFGRGVNYLPGSVAGEQRGGFYDGVVAGLTAKVNTSAIGAANGVAPLGADNLVPAQFLPPAAAGGGGGGGAVAGVDKQVQFNDGGVQGAVDSFTFDKAEAKLRLNTEGQGGWLLGDRSDQGIRLFNSEIRFYMQGTNVGAYGYSFNTGDLSSSFFARWNQNAISWSKGNASSLYGSDAGFGYSNVVGLCEVNNGYPTPSGGALADLQLRTLYGKKVDLGTAVAGDISVAFGPADTDPALRLVGNVLELTKRSGGDAWGNLRLQNLYAHDTVRLGYAQDPQVTLDRGSNALQVWNGFQTALTDVMLRMVRPVVFTVDTLPSPSYGDGTRSHVSDASAPVYGSPVVGGGAVSTPVYSNGAAWIVG